MVFTNLFSYFLFNKDLKYSEDYDLWLRITYSYKAAICLDSLVVLGKERVGQNGLSSNLWKMQCGELLNYFSLFKENKISFFKWLFVCFFSCLKYLKRVISNIKNYVS